MGGASKGRQTKDRRTRTIPPRGHFTGQHHLSLGCARCSRLAVALNVTFCHRFVTAGVASSNKSLVTPFPKQMEKDQITCHLFSGKLDTCASGLQLNNRYNPVLSLESFVCFGRLFTCYTIRLFSTVLISVCFLVSKPT